jgi:tetratricopeptide (TPR) repeat protein
MSLLLEALKKAERAKEEAQRRARGDATLAPESAAADATERKPVLTRDKLPDISPALEIVSEDLAAEVPPSERAAPELAPPPARESTRQVGGRVRASDDAASRASAKKVFEAKFREPNPRLPFFITLGVLGAFAVGTLAYFWYQLRPPPPLVNATPQSSSSVATSPTPVPVAASAVPTSAIAGLPTVPPKATPAPVAAPERVRAAPEARNETPRLRLEPRREEPRLTAPRLSAPSSEPVASIARPSAQVHPAVAAGYAAYLSGDFTTARAEYERALREEQANRDAMLGVAALDVRAGRYESAEALYLRLLQANPRDAQAQAALIGLRAGRSDPLATESRVKSLIAAEPGAHALNFTLGNQFANQNRWAEAQYEYFRAYTAEPENADFAYNLAVSLDHLRQPRQALTYYQRALSLAESRGASFDINAARSRAAELTK